MVIFSFLADILKGNKKFIGVVSSETEI
jgi:hypothetical protein